MFITSYVAPHTTVSTEGMLLYVDAKLSNSFRC